MKNVKIILKEIYGDRDVFATGIINNLTKWKYYDEVVAKKKVGVIKGAPNYIITISENYREEYLDSLAELAIDSNKVAVKKLFMSEGAPDNVEIPVDIIADDELYSYMFKFTHESDGIIYSNVNMII